MRKTTFEDCSKGINCRFDELVHHRYYKITNTKHIGTIVRAVVPYNLDKTGEIIYGGVIHSISENFMFLTSCTNDINTMMFEEIKHGKVTTEW